MLLYHFTALFHLPSITREGLTRGELPLPHGWPGSNLQVVNLTTNPNRVDQLFWATGSALDKTKIRLTVELPADGLINFGRFCHLFNPPTRWLKVIAPPAARSHWYYVPIVALEQITAWEQLANGNYAPISDLAKLVEQSDQEKERIGATLPTKEKFGPSRVTVKIADSWLLDGLQKQKQA